MRAIGYVRVSTEEQATSGLGLEAQERRVRTYAELYELELVDVVVDAGETAKTGTLDRPGLVRALARLEAGEAEALLIAKLDRLTRSVRDLGELLERGFDAGRFALMSVAENVDTRSAAGRLVLNVLVSVAQWERETIGERTSAALQEKRVRGERAGTIPFGFRLGSGGKLEEDADEQLALDVIRARRAAGDGYLKICHELERRGLKPRGKRWYPETVRAIARRLLEEDGTA